MRIARPDDDSCPREVAWRVEGFRRRSSTSSARLRACKMVIAQVGTRGDRLRLRHTRPRPRASVRASARRSLDGASWSSPGHRRGPGPAPGQSDRWIGSTPLKYKHRIHICKGWRCPAKMVPVRSSNRCPQPRKSGTLPVGLSPSLPSLTTSFAPLSGQATPSGQRSPDGLEALGVVNKAGRLTTGHASVSRRRSQDAKRASNTRRSDCRGYGWFAAIPPESKLERRNIENSSRKPAPVTGNEGPIRNEVIQPRVAPTY